MSRKSEKLTIAHVSIFTGSTKLYMQVSKLNSVQEIQNLIVVQQEGTRKEEHHIAEIPAPIPGEKIIPIAHF